MRKTIGALVALALLTAGCGSGGQTDTAAQERAAARKEAAIRAARLRARQLAEHAECERTFGALQDALGELDSRLSIGLTYANYGTEVADVQVAYDRIDTTNLDFSATCVSNVGLPLERALNQHLKAQQQWHECFEDWECETDSIDSHLQARWAKASRAVERSRRQLQAMVPDAEPAGPTSEAAPDEPRTQAERDQATIQTAHDTFVAECEASGEVTEADFPGVASDVAIIVLERPDEELANGMTPRTMADRLVTAMEATGACAAEIETLKVSFDVAG